MKKQNKTNKTKQNKKHQMGKVLFDDVVLRMCFTRLFYTSFIGKKMNMEFPGRLANMKNCIMPDYLGGGNSARPFKYDIGRIRNAHSEEMLITQGLHVISCCYERPNLDVANWHYLFS